MRLPRACCSLRESRLRADSNLAEIAAAVAIFLAVSTLGLTLLFALRLKLPAEVPLADVTLLLPLTGRCPGLEELIAALAAQTLKPRRLVVAVESADDPAYARVKALGPRYAGISIELVVAGLSPLRGQKSTNILAGLGALDTRDGYLVLLDADIRPQRWWLAALVRPLAAGRADLVNGYRWPVPDRVSLATAAFAQIDRAIATLPRLPVAKAVWGGSIGVTRPALEKLDLPHTIGSTLTEDLPTGVRAAAIGLRVLTRRALRVPTPLTGGWCNLWGFGRRQYQLIRTYRPGLWRFAAAVTSADLAARAILVFVLLVGDEATIAAAALVAVAALGSVALELRFAIGKRLGAADRAGLRLRQHLFLWMILPLPLLHAALICAGRITSPVRWAHIDYRVDHRGHVVGIVRRPHSGGAA